MLFSYLLLSSGLFVDDFQEKYQVHRENTLKQMATLRLKPRFDANMKKVLFKFIFIIIK